MSPLAYEIIPDQKTAAKPVFKTELAYLEFCQKFQDQVRPLLQQHIEARRQTEEAAKKHLVF